MSEERKSMFDGFEVDEMTGEVLVPRAGVGVAPETAELAGAAEAGDYIPTGTEELPGFVSICGTCPK